MRDTSTPPKGYQDGIAYNVITVPEPEQTGRKGLPQIITAADYLLNADTLVVVG